MRSNRKRTLLWAVLLGTLVATAGPSRAQDNLPISPLPTAPPDTAFPAASGPATAFPVAPLPAQPAAPPGTTGAAVQVTPVDAAAGSDANAPRTKNLLEFVRGGGPLMIPILFCSFLLLVFVFERLIALRRGRVIPGPFVKRFLEQLREGRLTPDEALKLCEENRSPVAQVFSGAIKKWGRPSVEVEQALIDEGERVTNGLRRYLRLFQAITTVSPLLGLLGTVLGMIQTFDTLVAAQQSGRTELLAGGISVALLTTAGGLVVAIPSLLTHLYFVSRVDRLIMDIDAQGQQVVELIASDSLREGASRSKSPKPTKAA